MADKLYRAVEAEFDFFLDPFHRLDFIEGRVPAVDVAETVGSAVANALQKVGGLSRQGFRAWALKEAEAAALARAESTLSLRPSTDIDRAWEDADYYGYAPPPIDGAGPSWLDPGSDRTDDTRTTLRFMSQFKWASIPSIADDLVLAETAPVHAARTATPDRYVHCANVQAARWADAYHGGSGPRALGDALLSLPVGVDVAFAEARNYTRGPRTWGHVHTRLKWLRAVRVAEWLTRRGAPNVGRFRLKNVQVGKANIPNALKMAVSNNLSLPPDTARRHIANGGFRLPGHLIG